MEILLFGALKEKVGTDSIIMEQIINVAQLKISLEQQFPQLKQERYRIAVNKVMAADAQNLQPTDTIALLPPFSGG